MTEARKWTASLRFLLLPLGGRHCDERVPALIGASVSVLADTPVAQGDWCRDNRSGLTVPTVGGGCDVLHAASCCRSPPRALGLPTASRRDQARAPRGIERRSACRCAFPVGSLVTRLVAIRGERS